MTTTTSELPEPFDLRSHNTASDKISELLRLFPEIRTEVVFLDEGFAGNDQLKANAVQTFKTKGVASFRTV
jgi:adenine-specific DNA-methyltransferase